MFCLLLHIFRGFLVISLLSLLPLFSDCVDVEDVYLDRDLDLEAQAEDTQPTVAAQGIQPPNGHFPVATLSNGNTWPMVGLGCSSGLKKQHVMSALALGYRHLDTAQAYQWGYDEGGVGDAVSESGVPREDLSIQTKIHPEDLGYAATKRAVEVSLKRLHTSFIDSVLIHKPRCWEGACTKQPEGTWRDSWRALEELYDSGKVRAIGICDVDGPLLDELLKQKHKPHIIQNWMDPFHQDKLMRRRCKDEGIQYQGYSTLGPQWVHFRGHQDNPVLANPMLNAIAKAHGGTVAQVVINWATRHGVAVIPASRNVDRQRSNLHSFDFELEDEEMKAIDRLDGKVRDAQPDPVSDEVSIQFENPGAMSLQVFWVNPSGEEVPMGAISPGSSVGQKTFHGHKFRFTQSGRVVGEHIISRKAGSRQRHRIEL